MQKVSSTDTGCGLMGSWLGHARMRMRPRTGVDVSCTFWVLQIPRLAGFQPTSLVSQILPWPRHLTTPPRGYVPRSGFPARGVASWHPWRFVAICFWWSFNLYTCIRYNIHSKSLSMKGRDCTYTIHSFCNSCSWEAALERSRERSIYRHGRSMSFVYSFVIVLWPQVNLTPFSCPGFWDMIHLPHRPPQLQDGLSGIFSGLSSSTHACGTSSIDSHLKLRSGTVCSLLSRACWCGCSWHASVHL